MIGGFIEPIAPSNMPLSSACTWLVFGGAMCRSLCSTYPNAPREATYWEGGVTVISRLSGSCVTPERTTRTRTDSPSVYWRSGTMAGLGTGSQREGAQRRDTGERAFDGVRQRERSPRTHATCQGRESLRDSHRCVGNERLLVIADRSSDCGSDGSMAVERHGRDRCATPYPLTESRTHKHLVLPA